MSNYYPPSMQQSRPVAYPHQQHQQHQQYAHQTSPPPHSPQSPYHPASPPPPPPPPPRPQAYQHHQQRPSTYQPVSFDTPSGIDPSVFYGILINPDTSRPTPIFSRLSDSLFFWLDSSCSIPGLRNTGVIEPEKYAWMTVQVGGSELEAQLIIQHIESLYEAAGLPVQYRRTLDGRTIAVLDRRAFLHSCVFEARADPDETWKFWQKALTLLPLTDPLSHTHTHPSTHTLPSPHTPSTHTHTLSSQNPSTLTPKQFPTPIPRIAFPPYPSPTLQRTYHQWQLSVVVEYQRRKGEEEVREVLEGVRRQSEVVQMQVQMQAAGLGGYGAGGGYGGGAGGGHGGAGGYNSYYNYLSASTSPTSYTSPSTYSSPPQTTTTAGTGGEGGGDHATKMDAITSVATLLNTGLSIFGGGGLGLGN